MSTDERPASARLEPTRLPRGVAALIGVVSVAATLAAGHLVAGLVGPGSSPFLAVGNTVRDLTPYSVTKLVIDAVGTLDKLLLFVGEAAVLLIFGVLAGLLSRRHVWPGVTLAAGLGLTGLLAVLYRPEVDRLGVLAPMASVAAGVGLFAWLHTIARRDAVTRIPPMPHTEVTAAGTRPSRRRFLMTSAGVAAGAGLVGGGGELLARRVDIEGSRAGVGALTPRSPAPAIPRGADYATIGTPRFLTSNADFYRIDTALTVPKLRARDWQLRIHGLVDNELTLSYDDIRTRPLVERTITLTCVSNEVGGPYISTANFIGVPLPDLLDEAGVRPGADQLLSTSIDAWTAGTPVDAVLDRDRGALLAIGMNGEPLPIEHGFPARMVVPGLYGFVSATKWVVDMELTTFHAKQSYWLQRGWGQRAPIKTQSRIDIPRGFATLPAGPITIAGIAWAQPVGIKKVEVRIDGGPWQQAELATEVNSDTWRMWRTTITLSAGGHTAEVRATDRTGRTQPEQRVPPIPDGATGWHSTQFTVT